MKFNTLIIRDNLQEVYPDVYTDETLSLLSELTYFNSEIQDIMDLRIKRRAERQQNNVRISFLDSESKIPRTDIKVRGNLMGLSYLPIFSVNGSRALVRPQNQMQNWRAASAMWLMLCYPALMDGCSTERMRWVRLRRCRSTTSGISNWLSTKIRSFLRLPLRSQKR